MKKSLFLIATIFSIFFITDRVDALSYTATDGKEYTVDSPDTLLDYCYYTYVKGTDKNLIFAFRSSQNAYYCIADTYDFYFASDLGLRRINPSLKFTYYIFDFNSYEYLSSKSSSVMYTENVLYSSIDLYSTSTMESISFNSNLNFNDIESKYGVKNIYTITYYVNNEVYKTIEVEEGSSHELLDYEYNENTHIFSSWQYDENIDLSNITSNIIINATLEEKDTIPVYIEFPINKTEFYVLLVEVGVLIMMLFLKWCYPFKGGSDL